MNKSSFFDVPIDQTGDETVGRFARMRQAVVAWRWPVLLVFLPTLLVAAYYYLLAADQYESEAHFIVSSSSSEGLSGGSFGSLFGLSTGGSAQGQISAVTDYLQSSEAVGALRRNMDLVGMFNRPEADALSRLGTQSRSPEDILKYFRKMVKVHYDRDTGITSVTVHAFRPEDAHAIANRLLLLGEEQVNRMNRRRYDDAVAAAQKQVALAEQRVTTIQSRMTGYRQDVHDINPEVTGEAQIRLVSALKAQLATAQASLASMAGVISPSSPQYIATQRQVAALRAQMSAQSGQLASRSPTDVASNLGGFEDLKVQQEFAAKNYEAAAAALVKAQEEAARQQLYVDRVVDANMPGEALFPQRGRIVLLTFIALCVAYGIGWLILAGVREHAA